MHELCLALFESEVGCEIVVGGWWSVIGETFLISFLNNISQFIFKLTVFVSKIQNLFVNQLRLFPILLLASSCSCQNVLIHSMRRGGACWLLRLACEAWRTGSIPVSSTIE